MKWILPYNFRRFSFYTILFASILIAATVSVYFDQSNRILSTSRAESINAVNFVQSIFKESLVNMAQDGYVYGKLIEEDLEHHTLDNLESAFTPYSILFETKPSYHSIKLIDQSGFEILDYTRNPSSNTFLLTTYSGKQRDPEEIASQLNITNDAILSSVDYKELSYLEIGETPYGKGLVHVLIPIEWNGAPYLIEFGYYTTDFTGTFEDAEFSSVAHLDVFKDTGEYLYSSEPLKQTLIYGKINTGHPLMVESHYEEYPLISQTTTNITQQMYEDRLITSVRLDGSSINNEMSTIDVGTYHTFLIISLDLHYYELEPVHKLDTIIRIALGVSIIISLLGAKAVDALSARRDKHLNELNTLSHHDQLTGMPNRLYLMEKLDELITQKAKFAILSMDFDGFKIINDTYGHHTGDLALQFGANRIKHAVRKDDFLARIGGDEFILILPDVETHEVALRVIKKIDQAFVIPFELEGITVEMGISIGLSISENNKTVEQLLQEADNHMYNWKKSQKKVNVR